MGQNRSRPRPSPPPPPRPGSIPESYNFSSLLSRGLDPVPTYPPVVVDKYSSETVEEVNKKKFGEKIKVLRKPVSSGIQPAETCSKTASVPVTPPAANVATPIPRADPAPLENIPPLPKGPTFIAYDKLFRVYKYYNDNWGNYNDNINDTVNEARRYADNSFHVCTFTNQYRGGAIYRSTLGDESTIKELIRRRNLLNNINGKFENIDSDENIKKDLSTSIEMLVTVRNYYDNTLPTYQTNKVVIPLKAEIEKLNNDITLYDKAIAAIDKEIENMRITDSLSSTLISNLADVQDLRGDIYDTMLSDDITNKQRLYNGVKLENNIFDEKVENDKETAVKYDRESNHVISSSTSISILYKFLFYSYFIILLAVVYIFFIADDYNINFNIKVCVVIVMIIYPFTINYIEEYFSYILKVLYSFATNKVYQDPKMDYNTSNKK